MNYTSKDFGKVGIDRGAVITPLKAALNRMLAGDRHTQIWPSCPGTGKTYGSAHWIPLVANAISSMYGNKMMYVFAAPNVAVVSGFREHLQNGITIKKLNKQGYKVIIFDNESESNEYSGGTRVYNDLEHAKWALEDVSGAAILIVTGSTNLLFDRMTTNGHLSELVTISNAFPTYVTIDEAHNSFGYTTVPWYVKSENPASSHTTKRQDAVKNITTIGSLFLTGTPTAQHIAEDKKDANFAMLPTYNVDNLDFLRPVNSISRIEEDVYCEEYLKFIFDLNSSKSAYYNSKEQSICFVNDKSIHNVYNIISNASTISSYYKKRVVYYTSKDGAWDSNGKVGKSLADIKQLLERNVYDILILVQAGSQGFDVKAFSTTHEMRNSSKVDNDSAQHQRITRSVRKGSNAPLDVFVGGTVSDALLDTIIIDLNHLYCETSIKDHVLSNAFSFNRIPHVHDLYN